MNSLITIIIPTYNSANTITEAIYSILNQTYKNTEIIIIDDKSTDNTEEIVKKIQKENSDKKILYYPLPFDDPNRFSKTGRNINAGYSARNYGLEKAQGEWITFQDADDISFLNRIEWQYKFAKKFNVIHICTNSIMLKEEWAGKSFDVGKYLNDNPDNIITNKELYKMAKKTKGFIIPFLGKLNSKIPFEIKTKRVINKLFFGNLKPYPASGNCPLVKKDVFEKVKFRQRDKRVWPSFVGRGADRDFNFQVAETFKNSIVVKIPLYMWRQDPKDFNFKKIEKYII
jgi:glycosyltransferase involved in cell wall biosynthesis